ncbi:MAG: transglutaminase family protein [Phycisphaerae bacterium]|nr:transglutaminase family protein [Phycisphaerae bacterium]
MLIQIGYDIRFTIPSPTPMLLLLHTCAGKYHFAQAENLVISPYTPAQFFLDHFGNFCTRLVAAPGTLMLTNEAIVEVNGQPDAVNLTAIQHPVQDLPLDTLPFLLASRYCEVDRLTDFAWQRFGTGPTGYGRVQAVCDFVHHHVAFGYIFANSGKSAFDTFNQRQGVCRDFAHLAITFCRCLGIPARYATGYLGDIGVPLNPDPMDFSAWYEAYLSGHWYTFDARHNHPRIGRVVMAYGRDAADTALTTTFGLTTLARFTVVTREL